MKYKDCLELAIKRNRELTCDDLGEDGVYIFHRDGSVLEIRNAIFEKVDEYFMVFAEHFQPMVFHEEDLIECSVMEI